jgi:Domain of unknown function (DUF4062)/prokaryotic YEATS domain
MDTEMEHRVFVSSTFSDLKDHRATVQAAIRQLGATDVSMEHFGARDARPRDECLRIIGQESDSFVGIYAHRYGHVPAGSKKSITEAEFDAAERAKLPRFTYVVDEEALWNPKYIDSGQLLRCLQRFKRRLMAELIVKTFSTGDQLATAVTADLGRHLATRQLTRVEPASPSRSRAALEDAEEWSRQRDGIYTTNRGLFLVHTLSPSRKRGQLFDIFIYLRKHKSSDTPEVEFAEFFLGKYWGNTVFRVPNEGGLVGLSTAAYGEFLCVCRVTFKGGTQLMLNRYIDFGSAAPPIAQPNKGLQPTSRKARQRVPERERPTRG